MQALIGFRSFIKRNAASTLIKVFGLTAISTLVKVLTGFISVKIMAVIIGPVGIALLGQLNNFTSIIMSVATGGITNGVVKYTAEYKDHAERVRIFLSTAFRITLYISAFCGLLLILFAGKFSELILLDKQYRDVFMIFGITIILYAFNNLFNSIINGYKEFRKYVIIAIIGSVVGLIFSLVLVWLYHIKGALISTVTYQSVIFFVTLFYINKSSWFTWRSFSVRISKLALRKYLSYTLMTLTSAATVPVTQLLVRGRLMSTLSATQAGWWEAMNRLSGMYLMMITTSFSIYYLPRLAELSDKKALKDEIFTAYKIILPILFISFTGIYFLRDLVIKVLFSAEFYPMNNLFFWQLTGDIFKIASWLLSFLMIAKSKTTVFMASEILFSLSYILLSYLMLDANGVVGVTQAYTLNYLLYFLVMLVWIRYFFKHL